MEVRKCYKQTEVGVIPEDWDVKKLGDCLIKTPRYGIGAAAVEYSDRLPKYIRITDISDDGQYIPSKIVSVDNPFSENYYLSSGDLVVARTGASVGKSYLYKPKDGPLVFAGFLICLSSNDNILLPQYLGSYCKTASYWNWVKVTSMRSGQPGINGKEYARLLIPIPPLPEQTAIAEALSDTDTLITSIEKLIVKKRNIKQGTMQELLTGRRRLPGFSGKWETKKLVELFNFSGGYSASREHLSSEGICYLHYGDIHGATKTYIDIEHEFLNIPKLQIRLNLISGKSLLNDGDVVFVDASEDDEGTSRHVVVKNQNGIPFISGLHTIVAKSKDDCIDNGFKRYCFQSDVIKKQFIYYAVGTKVSGISKRHIVKIELSFPSKTEQSAIASILSDMDYEIESLEQKLNKYKAIKQGMMQELLTGKTRLI